ncbi:MAG: FixH family protein [Saprospiraceae bacterium]
MNWGHGILAVIILFVLGIGSMVYVSSRQKIEMMDDQYYERELKHQSLIDGEENLNKAHGHITIYDSTKYLVVHISENVTDSLQEGNLNFLRPADKRLDRNIELIPNNGVQLIPKSSLVKGNHNVRVSWTNGVTPYYKQLFVDVN